jgi:hypothetical protein
MVLVQTKKGTTKGGSWNAYSYTETTKEFITKVRSALRNGYRVKVNGREVIAWDSKLGFAYKKGS